MSAVESLIFAYFLNAAWQFPLLAGSAALLLRLLRRPSPRTEHSLWILTSLLAALLPLAVGLGLLDPAPMTPLLKSQSPQLPPTGYRLLLAFVLFAALRKAVHFLRAAIATHRIRRSARPFGFREGVEIRISPAGLEAAGPLLTGALRPIILIPAFLTVANRRPLLETALAHELTHVRRHDLLTLHLTEVLLLPLAFHPLTDWLRRNLHAARELACDAEAQTDPIEYARCLLAIARHTIRPNRPLTALGIGSAEILERRILALAAPAKRTLSGREQYGLAILLLISCAILSGAARSSYLWLTSVPAPNSARRLTASPPPPPPPQSSRPPARKPPSINGR